ncbi:unnamed protein product [Didymodactylos carnosus]|uniref:BZIP domain-containing protein n=1 Tax=Didymodactylos carnosus TaxID=1234261 RepID=A0A813XCE1_9BILA|nr:unnamed protein product [Didymodactylos carnosus]CAF3655426.1 unnamed protein product [Didymodactylos carnosus]
MSQPQVSNETSDRIVCEDSPTVLTTPMITSDPVHVIKTELKQCVKTRQPTQSPFQKLFSSVKQELMPAESLTSIPVPSTAEVMLVIEDIQNSKFSDTIPLLDKTAHRSDIHVVSPDSDYSSSMFSPKKKFLMRSQSNNEFINQSVVSNSTNSRISVPGDPTNSKCIQIIIDHQQPFTFQVETDTSGQSKIIQNKNGPLCSKPVSVIQAHPVSTLNEVTSSNQICHKWKRQKIPLPPPSSSSVLSVNALRRKQIRDSNREAARRCRERRRQYIETLETSLEQQKLKRKQCEIQIQQLKRENIELKTHLVGSGQQTSVTSYSMNDYY